MPYAPELEALRDGRRGHIRKVDVTNFYCVSYHAILFDSFSARLTPLPAARSRVTTSSRPDFIYHYTPGLFHTDARAIVPCLPRYFCSPPRRRKGDYCILLELLYCRVRRMPPLLEVLDR